MSLRPIALLIGFLGVYSPLSNAAAISFDQAWQVLQQENNSLAAQRSNVERYEHLKNATDTLTYLQSLLALTTRD